MTLCTHCRQPLECKSDDIANCACQTVELMEETVQFLYTKTKHDCLCNDCLKNFDAMVKYASAHPFPKDLSEMEYGIHFYVENGNYVFTALYHLMKGGCCGNGCRHCVYGR